MRSSSPTSVSVRVAALRPPLDGDIEELDDAKLRRAVGDPVACAAVEAWERSLRVRRLLGNQEIVREDEVRRLVGARGFEARAWFRTSFSV